MHPETIDAMDYLYAHDDQVLGLCTFCYYHMIEYGVRNPSVMVGDRSRQAVDVRDRRAANHRHVRHLVPFHPIVTSAAEWRPLRGWTARTNTMPPTS